MRIPIPQNKDGSFTITPKKHTKVRRPMSRWQLEYMLFENNPVLVSNTLKMSVPPIKVNDISIGLEDPLWCIKYQSVWRREVFYADPKPSLLTRVKERFKR